MRPSRLAPCVPLAACLALATTPVTPARADPPPVPASSAASVDAPPAAPASPRAAPVRYTLPNGLRVVLAEDHRAGQVVVHLRVRAGAADDPPGHRGLAQLAARAMLGPTRHLAEPGAQVALLERAGATEWRADAGLDTTDLVARAPAAALHALVWLTRERLAFALDGIDARALAAYRRDALAALRARAGVGFGDMDARIAAELYPPGHPYRFPSAEAADLEATTVMELQWFVQRHYVPRRATLVVVGDFDPAQARAEIARLLGTIAPRPAPPARPLPPAPVPGAGTLRVEAPYAPGQVRYVWALPARASRREDAALELFTEVLAGGPASRLQRVLVHERALAREVGAARQRGALGERLEVVVEAQVDGAADALVPVIDRVVRGALGGPLGADELARARAALRVRALLAHESGVERAALLCDDDDRGGEGGGEGGDEDDLASRLARYDGLDARAVLRAVSNVLAPAPRLVVVQQTNGAAPPGGARAARGRPAPRAGTVARRRRAT